MRYRVRLGREGAQGKTLARGKQVLTMSSSVSRATQIACHVEASVVTCRHGNSDFLPFSLSNQWHFGS